MTRGVETKLDGDTLLVRIPMRFQRRGGRKRIVAPDGRELGPRFKPQPDGTLVKALARAWRWQRMLDGGLTAGLAALLRPSPVDWRSSGGLSSEVAVRLPHRRNALSPPHPEDHLVCLFCGNIMDAKSRFFEVRSLRRSSIRTSRHRRSGLRTGRS
jgi:hypothetical protein